MTISGSYPSDYAGQESYMNSVRTTFKMLDAKSSVVTVHGASEPSDAVLQAQWASQIPYMPPSNGASLNWFNPTTQRIEQVYYPILQGNGTLAPYKPKKTVSSGWECLMELVVGTAGQLDTGATIPQTHRHLLITYSARNAFAGTAAEILGLRLNNSAAATHQYITGFTTSGTTPNIGSATTATFGYAGLIPQDNVTDQAQAGVGHIFIPNYSISLAAMGQRPYHGAAASLSNNARPFTKVFIRFAGAFPTLGAITRAALFGTTNANLQRGSKMVIYGLK